MNFGRKATSKKQQALNSRSSKLGNKAGVYFIRIMFVSLIAVIVLGSCIGFGAFKGILDNTPSVEDVNITPIGQATFIYDEDGNQLQKLTAPTSNRLPVSLEEIPLDLQNAVVAVEDSRFYEHNGIDVRGIIRAGVKALTSGSFSEGASTITQQLLKNNVFTTWTSESSLVERFTRKFQEQYLALQLEEEVDKATILENYLNTINLGAGTYGVQAASHRYFDKDVWDLTLSECTVIAGITQNPSRFNPISHPEDNAKRREKVISDMYEQGYIDDAQKAQIEADDVYARIAEVNARYEEEENSVYSYYIDEVIDQVLKDLQEQKGYTEAQAYNALYSGGLRIYIPQDQRIQQICDEEYQNPENWPNETVVSLDYALSVVHPDGTEENFSKEKMRTYFQETDSSFSLLFDHQDEATPYIEEYRAAMTADGSTITAERIAFTPQPQSSVCIIDQHTGHVMALVGGRGEKTASLTLNRATDTLRQPGSTFKLVSTYAPALEACDMSLATSYDDEPYTFENGRPVKNASGSYGGPTTIRQAIKRSVNVVAVKCLTEITPELGYEYLKKFGFTTVYDSIEINGETYSDVLQPLALGGITRGVSNLELTAAYAAIANGGIYTKPIFYTKILDSEGNVVIDNTPETTYVISEANAYLLTSAMQDVVKGGTGTRLRLSNMPVAGKTGTTSGYNDVWFAGYTPYYTCATWAGYDNNEKLPRSGTYRIYHQLLWKKIMSRIHEDLEYVDFEIPESVKRMSVCTVTGLKPSEHCPTITEYFNTGTSPTSYCYYCEPEEPEEEETPEDAADPNNPEAGTTPEGGAGATPEGGGTTPEGGAGTTPEGGGTTPEGGGTTPPPDTGGTTQ